MCKGDEGEEEEEVFSGVSVVQDCNNSSVCPCPHSHSRSQSDLHPAKDPPDVCLSQSPWVLLLCVPLNPQYFDDPF